MKKFALLFFIGTFIGIQTAQAEDPPIISNFWVSTDLQKDECLSKATEAVKNAGFTKRFASTDNDVFGVTPDMKYTGQILCITEKGVVVFNVAGESGDKTHPFTQQLHKAFSE